MMMMNNFDTAKYSIKFDELNLVDISKYIGY